MNLQDKCKNCKKEVIYLQNQNTGSYIPVLITELITAERIDLDNRPEVEIVFNPAHHNNHNHICKEKK